MNANQLKLFMMGLMVLDHIAYFIPPELSLIFHVITRCVGVFFAYMAVEGVKYTRNFYRYNARLYAWAIIMMTGNTILNNLLNNPKTILYNNIFLTLAVGVTLLGVTKKLKETIPFVMKGLLLVTLIVLLLVGAMFTEGGLVILPFMLITFLTQNHKILRNRLYLTLSLLLFIMNFQWLGELGPTLQMLAYNSDFLFITVLPFIALYNGERGSQSLFFKYLFYFFYPAHLWLIAIIANFIQ